VSSSAVSVFAPVVKDHVSVSRKGQVTMGFMTERRRCSPTNKSWGYAGVPTDNLISAAVCEVGASGSEDQ
jgi:hypothetical protein